MTRSQFWILNCTVIVVVPLFFSECFLSRVVREDQRRAMILERIAQDGNGYHNRLQQISIRIYQLGRQDQPLKDVLAHQGINIEPKSQASAANGAPPSAPEATSPAPASVPSPTPSTSAPIPPQ